MTQEKDPITAFREWKEEEERYIREYNEWAEKSKALDAECAQRRIPLDKEHSRLIAWSNNLFPRRHRLEQAALNAITKGDL